MKLWCEIKQRCALRQHSTVTSFDNEKPHIKANLLASHRKVGIVTEAWNASWTVHRECQQDRSLCQLWKEKNSAWQNKYPSSWLSSMRTRVCGRDRGKGGKLEAKGTETRTKGTDWGRRGQRQGQRGQTRGKEKWGRMNKSPLLKGNNIQSKSKRSDPVHHYHLYATHLCCLCIFWFRVRLLWVLEIAMDCCRHNGLNHLFSQTQLVEMVTWQVQYVKEQGFRFSPGVGKLFARRAVFLKNVAAKGRTLSLQSRKIYSMCK